MPTLKALLLAGAASLLAPAAACADDQTVDTVIVTARRNPEDPPPVAEARSRLSQTPGGVSVISVESYARRAATALDDMLRDAPGVYAQRKWGGDIRLSIRGSGLGNAVHNRGLLLAVDGIPLNEADGFGDSQAVDPLVARFTEVYRGGNALRFGGALLGGAVNVVTPTGRNAGYGGRARIEGGSFGLAREHLALTHAGADWDMYVAATNQTAQGWRPQSQQNLQFGTLNLGRSFGEDREVRFTLSGASIAQEIPGALTRAQFEADPRQPAPANYANDYGRNQRTLRGVLRARWRASDAVLLDAGAYATWKDLDHPIFQVIDQQSRNYGLFGRLEWEGRIGGRRADLVAGLWLRKGDLDSNFYVNLRGARGAPTSISLQNAEAADVFAEGRLFVTDRLALVAGGAWGRAERRFRSFAVAGAPATFDLVASRTYEWFAPRAGLLWEADDGSQAYANVTRSVEPPNFGSLSPTGVGFAPVRAQEAWTAEAGVRGRRGRLTWDLTYYRAWLDGELLMFSVSPDRPATTFNADRTLHQGVEAAVDVEIATGWRLRQTWTWSDFRFRRDRDYGDNRLPVVPRHLYRAELRYEASQGWFAAGSIEHASGAWIDFANTARGGRHTVLNLNAGMPVTPRASLFVDVRNVTDERYVSNVQPVVAASPATAALWPADGRAAFAGITWTF